MALRALALAAAGVGGGLAAALWDSSCNSASCKPAPPCAFSPDEFREFRFLSSRYESHNVRRFYFALSDPTVSAHLPVASCVILKYKEADGSDVLRPYTPITHPDAKGHFEILVKRYPKGKMAGHLFGLQAGDTVQVKGPFIKFPYSANKWSLIGMIAGGTGITPMFQLAQCIAFNPADQTKMRLIYANESRRDILLANEISALQKNYPDKFHIYLTLQNTPQHWYGGVGKISRLMVETIMPPPKMPNSIILVCGPPGMMSAISGEKDYSSPHGQPKQGEVAGMLKELGYSASQIFKF